MPVQPLSRRTVVDPVSGQSRTFATFRRADLQAASASRSARAANPIPAAAPEDVRDPAMSNLARIRAVYERELELEQEEGKRLEGARKLRKEYVDGKMGKLSPAFSRQEYRAHILSHALFPNIYNYGSTHTYGGSS
tara:strand:+ start:868 stop:1275 length:408 start_codon:yes stop_codon:yes gene_type:complete